MTYNNARQDNFVNLIMRQGVQEEVSYDAEMFCWAHMK